MHWQCSTVYLLIFFFFCYRFWPFHSIISFHRHINNWLAPLLQNENPFLWFHYFRQRLITCFDFQLYLLFMFVSCFVPLCLFFRLFFYVETLKFRANPFEEKNHSTDTEALHVIWVKWVLLIKIYFRNPNMVISFVVTFISPLYWTVVNLFRRVYFLSIQFVQSREEKIKIYTEIKPNIYFGYCLSHSVRTMHV